MKIRAWLIACFSAVWAITSLAQQGPDLDADTAQGYVQNVFHHSSVDSVNVYNGSLTIPVALGPSYPIGPKLKLQAMLVYASKVWEYNRPAQPQNEPDLHSLVADPSLGFGWNLTMGAIKKCGPTQASTCYVSPDGAEHQFGLRSATITSRRMPAASTCTTSAEPRATRCGTKTATASSFPGT